ncbi:hypothetical protein SeMB42_g00367 [Synchytrium endobioticum]|uniref:Dynein heavy chain, cytoplasmic n=1 Tax=Synchytrium endobioticum TaxID=286115 RepID=A0A507DTI4_9FUNG|nr:hypothetical protein SeMB42_g00367 [Synchytrium endobioticum]
MGSFYRRRHLPLEPRGLSTEIPAVFSQPLLVNAKHANKTATVVDSNLDALSQTDPCFAHVEKVEKTTENASGVPEADVSNSLRSDLPSFRPPASSSKVLQPKVFIQYATLPGTVPRRVETERRRRLYASQNVSDLLIKEGIHARPADRPTAVDKSPPQTTKTDVEFLPLHWFDNVDHDERTVQEWVDAVASAATTEHPAQGKAQINVGWWTDVKIMGYHPASQRWRVVWHQQYHHVENNREQNALRRGDEWESWVHRIDLMFESEDPFKFVQRVAAAHRLRLEIAQKLRYNFFVDSMPTNAALEMTDDQVERIFKWAMAGIKQLSVLAPNSAQVAALTRELKIDYARTMNKMIFDEEITRPNSYQDYPSLDLPLSAVRTEPTPVPLLGKVDIPEYNFAGRRDEFAFASFLTKREVIKVLARVHTECERVAYGNLFQTAFGKTVKVDEFDAIQQQAATTTSAMLKDSWINTLKTAIKNGFRDVGKGWYNMHETNPEVYRISKLKKFMTTVKFNMQDAIRSLVLNSFNEYIKLITSVACQNISVNSTNDIRLGTATSADVPTRRPLFSVDLLFRNDQLVYSVDPVAYESAVLTAFDRVTSVVEGLPQLEPLVLDQLFWPAKPPLQSPHPREPEVMGLRAKLQRALREGIRPLEAYIQQFDKYLPRMNLDPAKYAIEYEEAAQSLGDVERLVLDHMKDCEQLERDVPAHTNLGMFWVGCESVRIAMRKDLAKVVLDVLARRTAKLAQSICAAFIQVEKRLRDRPSKIEEVAEQREYMETAMEILQTQSERISEMLKNHEVLEKFRHELTSEDSRLRWQAYGWPRKIEELLNEVEASLNVDEQNFARNLTTDQELFKERVNNLTNVVNEFGKHCDVIKVNEIVAEVNRVANEFKECQAMAALINGRERLFSLENTRYDDVAQLAKDFEPYKVLWVTAGDWLKWKNAWLKGPFEELNPEEVDKSLTNAWRSMFKSVKQFKSQPGCLAVATQLKDEMDAFKPNIPLIQSLRNPGMRDRHWEALSQEVGVQINPTTKSVTMIDLLAMGLVERIADISKICDVAGKEYAIEATLDKLENDWKEMQLDIIPYQDGYLMKASDEVQRLLDDNIVMIQSLAFSPFKKAFSERILSWETKLKMVQEVLEEWMQCQRQYLYLSPVFSSDDIVTQLPVESKRFQTMDRTWRRVMTQAKARPNVIECCGDSKLLDNFKECNKLLELVSKGLSAYLENKRIAFPRFFFLSDDELLQILSQTKDPTAVQPHLRKCFENVAKLEFQPDRTITAMFSGEGEKIKMVEPFVPQGNVETWLLKVEDSMRKSVKKVIMDGLSCYHLKQRTDWVLDWPGQVVLSVSQTYWTKEVSEALKDGTAGLKVLYTRLLNQLQGLVGLVRGELAYLQRLVLGDLIVIDVHARDVVQRLIDAGVSSENDFEWVSQLRYTWEEEDLRVRIVNANFKYGYEYLGNTGRLVITPLTDRCYLTLTGAMHLGMGGAPAGPAGTGKTETVKDLAKALAKQCVVFNCSDQLDYLAMAKFFKGLAAAGAWACFDEFNRIDIEVLSVIAQQIITIQKAAAAGLTTFMFEGVELPLDASNAIFITMNPGYAGRTELPDNLKALFRPVAMMIPNYAMIAEISLFSFGFSNAKVLADKMVATFKLSSEQLSSQDHYDFGMRAVKTVISSAGNLKRSQPDAPEDLLLLRALCDCNLPKFLAEDVPLFEGIISDLFPGVEQPAIDYGSLLAAINATCQQMNLQPQTNFLKKAIQLYETTIVRHGLMLVGPTGGGKTTCIRLLASSVTALHGQKAPNDTTFEKVRVETLNPKSITMGQLYGEFDPQTHEWTDGILSCLMREGVAEDTPDKKWYVFDGPVDAVWIESMNTLLDDNKKLCLSSGEIIKMSDTQRMIFEVGDLAYASPATVSRCGMIYMEPNALGLGPLIQSWVNKTTRELTAAYAQQFASNTTPLFEYYLEPALQFLRKGQKEIIPTMNGNLAQSLMRLMSALLVPYMQKAEDPSNNQASDQIADIQDVLEPFFIFSLIWSVGVTTDADDRRKFDLWLKDHMQGRPPKIPLPMSGIVHDYQFVRDRKLWVNWMETLSPRTESNQRGMDMIVPTMDTVRATGTGKSITIQQNLMKSDESIVPITLNFSARTSANQTQDLLDSKMEKRRKGVYGPPVGKKFYIFVDDLNMPALDICGAQPAVELLRQWLCHGGWFDRANVGKFMEIVDITLVGAMGPPGGGRNPVTPRFTRHFNTMACIEMDDQSMHRIFSTILGGFLSRFSAIIAAKNGSIVTASIHIYNTIRAELLPTPAKSHYTFNLRDLSKVIQGVLSADQKTVVEDKDIVRIWIHELQRVFQDRLVDNKDKGWFSQLIKDTMENKVGMSWSEVVTIEPLLYGDFLTPPTGQSRPYIEIRELRTLAKSIEEYMDDYNSTSTSPVKLVMFLDAIEHVSRICRIIRQPGGHALLLGVGGSGRQSLSRLASFMEDYELFQIEVTKSYGLTEWREDLKKVLLEAGIDERRTVFLIADTQIFSESCVEDINGILNSGDVPNIYNNEETDRIMNAMRSAALDAGVVPTRENMFALFLNRVKQNLHLIVCMSPLGDAFRNRLRMFPSLVNCCTIDWFSTWPEEALQSVAANSLAEVPNLGSEKVTEGIVKLCVVMHESVQSKCIQYRSELGRFNYVTPKSYLELLGLYKSLLDKKRTELLALRKRTATGLEKLLNATKEVEVLQQELEAMQPMLIQTGKDTEEAMQQITIDKIKAEEIREVVAREELQATRKAEETKGIADDAKRDLDEALPALEAAMDSLNNLSKNDIIEVRSMQRPPEGVKLVIEAVCILKGVKPKKIDGDKPGKKVDDYWEVGKAMLAEPQKFLESLVNFDKDNISEAVIQKIKPYIDSEEFQVEVIARVSRAATSICQWVRAMEKYYWVSRSVAPKRARLQEAQESLDATMKTLAELKRTLLEADISIKEMEKKFAESVAKKEELSRKVEECSIKLSRAGKLISGLGGERLRWAQAVEAFDLSITNVVGDVLLSAAAVAYLGPFTSEYRQNLVKKWAEFLPTSHVPHSENVSFWNTLGEQVKLREWQLNGLPKDAYSRDNGLIVQYSRRWPLLIDPQGQSNRWIRNKEKDNSLDVIKLTDRDFVRTLENAVRFGKPVLLENVAEKLDPALEPILLKQTFRQGGQTVIKVGDSVLPYHDDFRFYITTKLPNPHYSPETSAIVTLVNFTLAPSGLEDQLLALVVANERPDLEEAKNELVMNNAAMKKELKDIEDKILYLLSSVQGSPVDDERLIDTLAASKETSEEIQSKVAIAERTEKDIDITRMKYQPVAVRTRILFFTITELTGVDPMYQYSLGWFMNLFTSAIAHSEKVEDVAQRVVNINEYFTFSLFSNVCRSLFERHKLMFSFLLSIRILMNDGMIDMDEWRYLLAGGLSGSDQQRMNPVSDWLSASAWSQILMLSSLPNFSGIESSFTTNGDQYKVIFDSAQPHREKLPAPWPTKLNGFQKLLVLRCLRPDRVTSAIQDFVAAELGVRFIEPQTSDVSALFKESNALTPLIFVLSPGADPASALYKFAEDQRFSKKLSAVSLGQGQGPKAEVLIRDAAERGLWVLLQNCHLAPSWMPTLDRIVDGLTQGNVHRDFRLWLTSMPSARFPVSILQNGLKMSQEPPKGIKANLMRAYSSYSEEYLNGCEKPREWKKLLFALSFFHAVVQERRKFGPLGWNIPYEFTDGDCRICTRQLKIFLEEYDEVPFKVLKYTVAEINYGGRVTDDWDRRLILNILDDFYNANVLEDGHKFSSSDVYVSIAANNYAAYRDYIKQLPIDESTEIFAMHDNANITFAQTETYSLFDTLVALMPKSSSSASGKTREQFLMELAISIQNKIPAPFNEDEVLRKYPNDYKESMSTVLVQEVIRYNRLLSALHSSLAEVRKALVGLVVMSEALEAVCNALFVNQVPSMWAAKAYPSLKPLNGWVSDLMARCEFLQKWIDNGQPAIFWLSGIFFPQALLSGVLQNFARKYNIAIDQLSFEFKMLDGRWEDLHAKPADGCYIRGLNLEGARWDAQRRLLVESRPKELYTDFPPIWLIPKANRKKPELGYYECPVYKTLTRAGTLSTTGHSTNFVFSIEVPSDLPQAHWIKRGVALILSLAS